ncbi:hypothetical protein ABVK25_007857 [Lepraria finkii]|uniref:Uncharacterized protein n=1 Tax=Lepraria finkii TaxID=1340010 RepID=A0ABR4B211_9LECA
MASSDLTSLSSYAPTSFNPGNPPPPPTKTLPLGLYISNANQLPYNQRSTITTSSTSDTLAHSYALSKPAAAFQPCTSRTVGALAPADSTRQDIPAIRAHIQRPRPPQSSLPKPRLPQPLAPPPTSPTDPRPRLSRIRSIPTTPRPPTTNPIPPPPPTCPRAAMA